MSISKAIEIAVENGYSQKQWNELCPSRLNLAITFLDPKFWQCLGKGLGFSNWRGGHIKLQSPSGIALDKKVKWGEYSQHRFIDYLATGKTPEQFFKEINPT